MALDCTNMSAAARGYAIGHGYCPKPGEVTSNAVVYGNCGDSWIYIWNVGWGYADVDYGFDSSMGTVVYRNLGVQYWGIDNGGGWPDSGWMASSSYGNGQSNLWVGEYGWASALEGGTVTLWWGGQCQLLVPEDSTYED